MAHLRCDVYSDALGLSTALTVLLPQPTSTQIGLAGAAADGPPPVLYLLHGLSDDDTIWVRRTSVERYVAPYGYAVVMPQVHRSFYSDAAYGGAYWTFLSQELPELVGRFFRVSDRREDTFVAGLSMGGYGALKWALRQPSRFAAAASMSGALDVAAFAAGPARAEDPRMFDRIFAGPPPAEDDLFALLATADPGDLPALHLSCGTEDDLVDHTGRFAALCAERGVPAQVDLGPGEHEWGYWDARIADVLAWIAAVRAGTAR